VQDMTPELVESLRLPKVQGALIIEVLNDSPAGKAGLKPGDILVAIEAKPVVDQASSLNIIAALKPGSTAMHKVLRDKQAKEIRVSVGKRPKPKLEEK